MADGSAITRATILNVLATNPNVTGVFAPACNTHTGLTNDNFTLQTVQDFDEAQGTFVGPARTMSESLLLWLSSGPVRIIDAGAGAGAGDGVTPSSVCLGGPG